MATRRRIIRRTTIPAELLSQLGVKLQWALREEHARHIRKTRRPGLRFSTRRVCEICTIPFDTMESYLRGVRQPSLLDFRDICKFVGLSMEDMLSIIPSRVELDNLHDLAKLNAAEIERLKQLELEDDLEEDEDD